MNGTGHIRTYIAGPGLASSHWDSQPCEVDDDTELNL